MAGVIKLRSVYYMFYNDICGKEKIKRSYNSSIGTAVGFFIFDLPALDINICNVSPIAQSECGLSL